MKRRTSGTTGRLLYTSLAPFLSFLLWWQLVAKVGAAYLPVLLSTALSWLVLLHVSGLAIGVLGATFPSYPSAAGFAVVQAGVGALVASLLPLAFESSRWFSPFTMIASLLFGSATGLVFGAFGFTKTPSRHRPPTDRVFDLLQAHVLGPGLLVALGLLVGAYRLGPIRATLATAALVALFAHFGLTAWTTPPDQRTKHRESRWSPHAAALVALLCAVAVVAVDLVLPWASLGHTLDSVVLVKSSPYSQILLTSGRGSFQFYLDGAQKFSTLDSHRTREALVHPAMVAASRRREILLIEGGDGAALREILRYDDVEHVTVVEPDAALLTLAQTQPVLVAENAGSLQSSKVRFIVEDPLLWLKQTTAHFDVIVLDLSEPTTPRRSKLLATYSFRLLRKRLTEGGVGALRTAPLVIHRPAHECLLRTLEAAQLFALPYSAGVPTYGASGHTLFSLHPLSPPTATGLPPALRYLDPPTLTAMFRLPPNEEPLPVEVNQLNHQALLNYWDYWGETEP